MSDILLKNGEIVSSKGSLVGHVYVKGGKIHEIFEQDEKVTGKFEVIDCKGKLILPGVIDAHVHFREPGQEYKEGFLNGSLAALSGGVTTVCDMPNNMPPILTVSDLNAKRKKIKGKSYVNYGLYIGYNGENIDEINESKGACAVKIFCANSTGDMGVSVSFLENAFKFIDKDKLLVFHAEDEDCIAKKKDMYLAEFAGREIDPSVHSKIRSVECAVSMVKRVCELAKEYKRPIHICHITTEEEADVIAGYRDFGVTCEVTPHHLTLSEDDYEYFKNYIKVNPPVRSRSDVFGLWKAVKSGLVDIFASDHAPHTREEKEQGYEKVPSGVPGVEMLLPIFLNTVNNDGMTIQELVHFCCERPAEIFSIKRKGFIKPGYDADLVVVDMDLEKSFEDADVKSKCGWLPYSGGSFKGWPIMAFVGGKLAMKDGEVHGEMFGEEIF